MELNTRKSLQTCNLDDIVTAQTRLINSQRVQAAVQSRHQTPPSPTSYRAAPCPPELFPVTISASWLICFRGSLTSQQIGWPEGNWIQSDVSDAPIGCVCACLAIMACLSLTWGNCWWTLCNPRAPSVSLRPGPRPPSRKRQTSEKQPTEHASIVLKRDNYTNKKPAEGGDDTCTKGSFNTVV